MSASLAVLPERCCHHAFSVATASPEVLRARTRKILRTAAHQPTHLNPRRPLPGVPGAARGGPERRRRRRAAGDCRRVSGLRGRHSAALAEAAARVAAAAGPGPFAAAAGTGLGAGRERGLAPPPLVAEGNNEMRGTYAMLDAYCRRATRIWGGGGSGTAHGGPLSVRGRACVAGALMRALAAFRGAAHPSDASGLPTASPAAAPPPRAAAAAAGSTPTPTAPTPMAPASLMWACTPRGPP